jgi:hypothetical protein
MNNQVPRLIGAGVLGIGAYAFQHYYPELLSTAFVVGFTALGYFIVKNSLDSWKRNVK